MKKILLFLILILTGTIGFGQYTFTGSGDGTSWDDPNNWNPANIPLTAGFTGVSVTIPAGFNVEIPEDLTLNFTTSSMSGSGTVNNYGTFIIVTNNTYKYFNGGLNFNNYGIFNVGNGSSSSWEFRINNNSKLVNKPDGTFIINGTTLLQEGGNTNIVFENQGTVQKTGTDKGISVNMKNTGTISVLDGLLVSNGTESFLEGGTYNIAEDAIFSLDGKHHLKSILSGNSEGNFRFNNMNIIIDTLQTATNNINGNGIIMTGTSAIKGPGKFVNNKIFTLDSSNSYKYFHNAITFTNNSVLNVGNGGSTSWDLHINNDSKLINTSTGTVVINGKDVSQENGTSNIVFENQGLLQKIGFDKTISANMKNTGTIEVTNGTLYLNPANSEFINGVYNVFAEAALNFNGTHHFEGNLSGLVNGELRFNSMNIFIDDGKTAANNIEGNGIIMTGTSAIKGPGKFVNNKIFTLDSSNNYKYFQNEITFTNNSVLNVGNGGSTSWDLRINNESKLINSVGAKVVINGKEMNQESGNTNIVFENHGLLQKTGVDRTINVNTENDGTIEVLDGKLTLNPTNSYFDGGIYNVPAGAFLIFNGTHHLKGSLNGTVNGELDFNVNIKVDEGDTAINNIDGNGILMTGTSAINGPGNFINNKTFTLDSGNNYKYLHEEIIFTNNSILNIGSGTSTSWDFRINNDSKLINTSTGTVVINGKDVSQENGTSNIVYENQGLLQKAGANTKSVSARTENTGTIEVVDGKLNLTRINNLADGLITGGNVGFDGANFTNTGTFNPGNGIRKMTVDGFFAMNDGTLEFDLNGLTPETEYDVLNYTGGALANLSGEIKVNLGFEPEIGDTFTVLTSNSNLGTTSFPATVTTIYNLQYFTFTVTVNQKNIVLELVEITDVCPGLYNAPPNVTFDDSSCQSGCEVSGGQFIAPEDACPEGAFLEYSTDGGTTWSTDLPVYNQTEAMTVTTRCSCEEDPNVHSPESDPVTTQPGECIVPDAPVITIVDSGCDGEGSISANDPETGFDTEWKVGEDGEWTSETPEYGETSITVYARFVNTTTGCMSEESFATTAPGNCPPVDTICIEYGVLNGVLPTMEGATATYTDGNQTLNATYTASNINGKLDMISGIFGYNGYETAVPNGTETVQFDKGVVNLVVILDDIDNDEQNWLTFYDEQHNVISQSVIAAALDYTGSMVTVSFEGDTLKAEATTPVNGGGDNYRIKLTFSDNVAISKIIYTQDDGLNDGNYSSMMLAAHCPPPCSEMIEPTITINDFDCNIEGSQGSISAFGCAEGASVMWSIDGENWSTEAPAYDNNNSITVYAKCVLEDANCESTVAQATTNPDNSCTPSSTYDCPELEANIGDACTTENGEAGEITPDCGCEVKQQPEGCFEEFSSNIQFEWNYEAGERPANEPINELIQNVPGKFGMRVDIYELDNSFRMRINSMFITEQEIEFAELPAQNLSQNIMFADGDKYGSNGIPDIWSMHGTQGQPILQIIIDRDGNVSMMGTKSMGSNYQLVPLKLFNNLSGFNNIGPLKNKNNVRIRQNTVERTVFSGEFFNTAKVKCPKCNNAVYFSQSKGKTGLYRLQNGNLTLIGTQQTPLQYRYNAIGMNPLDNFIYAMESNTGNLPSNHILRIHPQTGETRDLGEVSGLPEGLYGSGTFDRNGNYYIMPFGSQNFIYKIQIANGGSSAQATQLNLSRSVRVDDFAYADNDGDKLYGVNRNGRLVEIDLNSGPTLSVKVYPHFNTPSGSSYGGVYWKPNNNRLMAYNSGTGNMYAFKLDLTASNMGRANQKDFIGLYNKNVDMTNCIGLNVPESEFDCPELEANIGDDCTTESGEAGVVTEDCGCEVKPEPSEECEHDSFISGSGLSDDEVYPSGKSISANSNFESANDIIIPAFSTFEMKHFTFALIVYSGMPTDFKIQIHEDNGSGGVGSPITQTYSIPSSDYTITYAGDWFGIYPIYEISADISNADFLLVNNSDTPAHYWISVQGATTTSDNLFWLTSDYSEDNETNPLWFYDGETWAVANEGTKEGAFKVEGVCNDVPAASKPSLPQSDLYQFSYQPNPVKDVLHINSSKQIEAIKVYNLTSQEVMSLGAAKAVNGEVDVRTMPKGVYVFRVVLEGGNVETFKVVKK